MSDIMIRHTVESLFAIRCKTIEKAKEMAKLNEEVSELYQEVNGYSPYRIENSNRIGYLQNDTEKSIDQALWRYLVKLYNLEKFMLCTDYEKMVKEIEEFRTPDFTIENANGWIAGLKSTIRDNVNTLVKKVYAEITSGHYYTGGAGYRGEKKKRNNNGIDKNFILYTADWGTIFAYWSSKPSIMDDLEKVCYILNGKTLPEKTLRNVMKGGKVDTASNDYMSVRVCRNGNTHFAITDETRNLLNKFGPSGCTIGEDIKIKIFER